MRSLLIMNFFKVFINKIDKMIEIWKKIVNPVESAKFGILKNEDCTKNTSFTE